MYFTKVPFIIQALYRSAIWSSAQEARLQLSFDDGPHPDSTPVILDILDRYGIKASFFCLGRQAEKYPELIAEIKNKGHLIGHHGYDHLDGWKTPTLAYLDNMTKSKAIIGPEYYRPPYGRITLDQKRKLKDTKLVFWTHMPGDFDPKRSVQQCARRIADAFTEGSIICLHDRPDTLEKVIAGLEMIAVRKLIMQKPHLESYDQ